MTFGKVVGNLIRVQEITRIFFRHGFGDLLQRMGLAQYLTTAPQPATEGAPADSELKTAARSFRESLEECGGALVKLGQLLSTRPDLLPKDWIEELSRLQDDVQAIDFEPIRQTLESELGSINESFSWIDPVPLAAGSVAQVHPGTTLAGDDVVVKVRKPGVKKTLLQDCDILQFFAELLEGHVPESRNYRPIRIVEEFRNAVINELDFTNEGRNLDRFIQDFEHDPLVIFPRPHWDQTTERVITMTRIMGTKISLTEELRSQGTRTSDIAGIVARSILKQILELGFFHGDPHPGNLMVVDKEKLCFLDCGMVGRLDERMRENLILLVAAGIRKDAETVTDILIEMNSLPNDLDRARFLREADLFLERYHRLPLKRIRLSTIVEEVVLLINKFNVQIPSELILVGKALITLEGVGRNLDPEFDAVATAEPLVRDLVFTTYGPRFIGRKILQGSRDVLRLLRDIPSDLRELSRTLRENQLKIIVEHRGLREASADLDRAAGKISASIVMASLILGSSIIIHACKEPVFRGVPIMGLGGIVAAALIGVWLAIAPLVNRRKP
jgi:ubiquinone biosynthesis protein